MGRVLSYWKQSSRACSLPGQHSSSRPSHPLACFLSYGPTYLPFLAALGDGFRGTPVMWYLNEACGV